MRLAGKRCVDRPRISITRSGWMPQKLPPIVTWGTSPEDVGCRSRAWCRTPTRLPMKPNGSRSNRALKYMGLNRRHQNHRHQASTHLHRFLHQRPHRGSARAAKMVEGKTVNGNLNAMIVPGSGIVKEQAEAEGLDKIFLAAGFEWREPGCSMCLA